MSKPRSKPARDRAKTPARRAKAPARRAAPDKPAAGNGETSPQARPPDYPEISISNVQGLDFYTKPIEIDWESTRNLSTYFSSRRSSPRRSPERSTIFVAYPYDIPKPDYRKPFNELSKAFGVTFQFADEKITSQQILDKITEMIRLAHISLFDVTTWNPNVALELGVAVGLGRDYYLLFNPSHAEPDVPSDLGGIDRLQYTSFAELEEVLTALLIQEFGVPTKEGEGRNEVDVLRGLILKIVEEGDGPKIGEIAEKLGINLDFAKAIVRPLVSAGDLETAGQTRGTRYYLRGQRPTGHGRRRSASKR